jgi:nucleoside-diphosphate-sugar epimerase
MTTSLVLGASGFIGQHFVDYLKKQNHRVIGVDRYPRTYESDLAVEDEFYIADLSIYEDMESMITSDVDEIYHFAAEVGGSKYNPDDVASLMNNNIAITTNLLRCAEAANIKNIFFASSSSVYPEYFSDDPQKGDRQEDDVFPTLLDNNRHIDKFVGEKLMLEYSESKKFRIRIGRIFDTIGTPCAWNNGREAVAAALCRKISRASDHDTIRIWSTGEDNHCRGFLSIGEVCEGIYKVMQNEKHTGPFNIGSSSPTPIMQLAHTIATIANKKLNFTPVPGPLGSIKKYSDNSYTSTLLKWRPVERYQEELEELYAWVDDKIKNDINDERPV